MVLYTSNDYKCNLNKIFNLLSDQNGCFIISLTPCYQNYHLLLNNYNYNYNLNLNSQSSLITDRENLMILIIEETYKDNNNQNDNDNNYFNKQFKPLDYYQNELSEQLIKDKKYSYFY